MGTLAEKLFMEVIKLPAEDRGDITLRLLDTLDESDEVSDSDLLAELQDRLTEGFDGALTWDELRQTR